VFLVQVRSRSVTDEELGSVGVRARVGHGEDASVGVGQPNLLISKLLSINTLASSSVSLGGVATLHHEAVDDSVELVALVRRDSLVLHFSCAQDAEVFGGQGALICEKLEYDTTFTNIGGVFGSTLDVKENLRVFGVEGRKLTGDLRFTSLRCKLLFV